MHVMKQLTSTLRLLETKNAIVCTNRPQSAHVALRLFINDIHAIPIWVSTGVIFRKVPRFVLHFGARLASSYLK